MKKSTGKSNWVILRCSEPRPPRSMNSRERLWWAVSENIPELVKRSIYEGGDINTPREDGLTSLHLAAARGFTQIVIMLLEAEANPNAMDDEKRTPLSYAIEAGHTEVAVQLLDYGANPSTPDVHGWTPLMWAAWSGNPDSVRILLEAKANPHYIDPNYGETALTLAEKRGHQACQALIKSAILTMMPGHSSHHEPI